MYRWKGEIQEDQEVAFIAKTRQDLVDSVIERVSAVHSYDCPCVVSIGIDDGNPDFLQWIQDMTSQFPKPSAAEL